MRKIVFEKENGADKWELNRNKENTLFMPILMVGIIYFLVSQKSTSTLLDFLVMFAMFGNILVRALKGRNVLKESIGYFFELLEDGTIVEYEENKEVNRYLFDEINGIRNIKIHPRNFIFPKVTVSAVYNATHCIEIYGEKDGQNVVFSPKYTTDYIDLLTRLKAAIPTLEIHESFRKTIPRLMRKHFFE